MVGPWHEEMSHATSYSYKNDSALYGWYHTIFHKYACLRTWCKHVLCRSEKLQVEPTSLDKKNIDHDGNRAF